jgi:hypothetical protein
VDEADTESDMEVEPVCSIESVAERCAVADAETSTDCVDD